MSDAIKIALKTALIAGVMVAAVAILNAVQVPQIDLTVFRQGIGHAKAIMNYFGGTANNALFLIGFALLSLKYVLLPSLTIGAIAVKWIFKVNE